MKVWTEEEFCKLKYYYLSGKSYKEIANLLNRSVKSVERKLVVNSIIKPKKCQAKNFCLECNNVITSKDAKKFCGKSCAAKFNNKNRDPAIYKKLSETHKSANLRPTHVNLKTKPRFCEHCLVSVKNYCKYCTNCKKHHRWISLYKKVNLYTIGVDLKEIDLKVFNFLSNMYFTESKSKVVIQKELGVDSRTLYNFFKSHGVSLRSLSESFRVAYVENRVNLPENINTRYKTGYHTSWEGFTFFYRSSYELVYAKYLDKLKIKYRYEPFRITYLDKRVGFERTAIPDFYLVDYNKIVEVKSHYTLDELNLLDKADTYKKLGYDFELICCEEIKQIAKLVD